MEKVQYETMMKNLNDRYDYYSKTYDKAIEVGLENMTIKEVKKLINKAKVSQSELDRLATTELYHVIGMGDLTAPQVSSFIKLFKKVIHYRHIVKILCCSSLSMFTLNPAEYKCTTLGIDLKADNYAV